MLKLISGNRIPAKKGGIYYVKDYGQGFGIYTINKIEQGYIEGNYYFCHGINDRYSESSTIVEGPFCDLLSVWASIKDYEIAYLAEPEDIALLLLTKAPLHEISDNRHRE